MTLNFFLLLFCHWLGDFTHLSRPSMLAAKAKGEPLSPIAMHAFTHASLMLLVLGIRTQPQFAWLLFLFQLVTHFIIDVAKGKIQASSSLLQNNQSYWHWWLFGFDQMLHITVIYTMAYVASLYPF